MIQNLTGDVIKYQIKARDVVINTTTLDINHERPLNEALKIINGRLLIITYRKGIEYMIQGLDPEQLYHIPLGFIYSAILPTLC